MIAGASPGTQGQPNALNLVDTQLMRDLFVANTVFVVAACAVLLWVSWQVYQRHRLPFLKLWVAGWCCYLGARLVTWLQLGPLQGPGTPVALGLAFSIGSQVGYYLHVVLVMLALLRLSQRWVVDIGTRGFVLLVVVLLAYASSISLLTQGLPEWRPTLRVGLRCAVTAVVFAVCGSMLLRHGQRLLRLGPRLTGIALWSGATVFGFYAYAFSVGDLVQVMAYLGAAEVLFVCMLGLGLALWTQEDLANEARFVSEELGKRNLELARAQRVESLGQIAGSIAHDFHNVLTVVSGNLEYALQRRDLDSQLHTALLDASNASEQAGKLTKRLLGMARQSETVSRRLDLNLEVGELLPLLRSLLGRSIDLHADLVSGTLPVLLQPGQVEQVLINLVANARDAIQGHGTATIRTFRAGTASDVRVGLIVRDTGVGMSDEVRARVGDLFFSTKGDKGTGIGMAAVRGMLEGSGGRLLIDSNAGVGTTVQVCWPEHRQSVAPTGSAEPVATAATILVVEDDSATRRTLRATLERVGYRVVAPEDSQAAAAILLDSTTKIDLLLSDVVMPGLSGPQLLLVSRRSRPSLTVRFISGSVFGGGSAGLEGVPLLEKPFTGEQLLRFVAAALQPADTAARSR